MPVQHIALLQFKSGTSDAVVQTVIDELKRLTKVIPGIVDFSIGTNNSPEGLAGGHTHGFAARLARAARIPRGRAEAALEALAHAAFVQRESYAMNFSDEPHYRFVGAGVRGSR